MPKQTVLLVNLGSPKSPAVGDVREYLREFLSDPRVLDGSPLVRQMVLNLFILPFRPSKSAAAYRTIWTHEGSPLIVVSKKVQALLQQKLETPVELAMRYGEPSIPEVIERIAKSGCEELLLIPLYPHYAMSSYETVVVKVRESLAISGPKIRLKVQPPFYSDPAYLRAMIECAAPFLQASYDHVLFSFHGLPERHLRMADSSRAHCLTHAECCLENHPAHSTCYRAQAFQTVHEFVAKANIPTSRYSISFQSRLGRDSWLKPYTDYVLRDLATGGVRNLLVICPAFVSDCLETLEEIAIRGKEIFIEAGGEQYEQIPCLNDHPLWIEALAGFSKRLAAI